MNPKDQEKARIEFIRDMTNKMEAYCPGTRIHGQYKCLIAIAENGGDDAWPPYKPWLEQGDHQCN